jgi:hypothetical protein
LNITPLSISYEYEPCDILKAREIVISSTQKYVKAEGEDFNSIVTGIMQPKGDIHLQFCKPITSDELDLAAACDKNDRYQHLRHTIDVRVIDGYKLFKNNYIAYDLLNSTDKYSHMYEKTDQEKFVGYMNHQLGTVEPELNREDLRKVFLEIYANSVVTKELLEEERKTGTILL